MRRTLLIAIAAGSTLLSCSKTKATDCGAASAHFSELLRAELAKSADQEELKTARANIPTLQNALYETCQKKKWSQEVRNCILAAKTAADVSACDPRDLGKEQEGNGKAAIEDSAESK